MNLSPEINALLVEALGVRMEAWAEQQGWPLKRAGGEMVGPCPKCGGTDRFSINTVEQVFNCRGCGVGGDIVFLVRMVENLTFVPALERITGRSAAQPVDPQEVARRKAVADAQAKKRAAEGERRRQMAIKDAELLWKASRPAGAIVAEYLGAFRGLAGGRIDFAAPDWAQGMPLRFVPDLAYHHGGKVLMRAPAMLAKIAGRDGRGIGVHRTWLDFRTAKGKLRLCDDKGEPLPAKKVLGSKKGGAIRLITPPGARRLVMGEGIETTLTAYVHAFESETAYWAGVDLGNMAGRAARDENFHWLHDQPDMDDTDCFVPPDWVEELVFLGEGDAPAKHPIEKATRGLRRAARLRPGLKIALVMPPGQGLDLNELVLEAGDGQGAA